MAIMRPKQYFALYGARIIAVAHFLVIYRSIRGVIETRGIWGHFVIAGSVKFRISRKSGVRERPWFGAMKPKIATGESENVTTRVTRDVHSFAAITEKDLNFLRPCPREEKMQLIFVSCNPFPIPLLKNARFIQESCGVDLKVPRRRWNERCFFSVGTKFWNVWLGNFLCFWGQKWELGFLFLNFEFVRMIMVLWSRICRLECQESIQS